MIPPFSTVSASPKKALPRLSQGFSLVEVTLALGVAAVCLLAIFGLLPIGLNSNQASVEQTTAASLTRSIISDLRSTPVVAGTTSVSTTYGIIFPNLLTTGTNSSMNTVWFDEWGTQVGNTAGTSATAQQAQAKDAQSAFPKYRAFITLTPPATTSPKSATFVRTIISWPAFADSTPNSNPAHAAGTYETVTALDRN